VARTFDTVADLLAVRGDRHHRILAYRRASESIQALGRTLVDIRDQGSLTEIPGIGAALALKIEEMLDTGRLAFLEQITETVPASLIELLRVDGLGPRKVKVLYDSLAIADLDGLRDAAESGRLSGLKGFGARSEKSILVALDALERHGDQLILLEKSWPISQSIVTDLERLAEVEKVAVAGSLRRVRETSHDVDILVASSTPIPVIARFISLPHVEIVQARGTSKASVILLSGEQIDLRVLPPRSWGNLLAYFTGSKAHNVRLRELALKKGLTLNEHCFTNLGDGSEIYCAEEEDLYATLGLPYIPPVLREDRGEIESAQQGALPLLVRPEELMGDLHVHSTWSDGRAPILEMARAAQARGHSYLAICDHSASLGIANGLSVARLREQAAEIAEVNLALGDQFTVLHGTELEIKANGTLDYPDEVLAELDIVVASLHVSLRQDRQQVTSRMLSAIANPHVDIIAHPTGRLLPDRPGADLDMDAVLSAAAKSRTILEVNANPRRLDLSDIYIRRAIELGVKLSINSDAHDTEQQEFLHFGVATAQRGWATADDVVNTWELERIVNWIDNSRHIESHAGSVRNADLEQ